MTTKMSWSAVTIKYLLFFFNLLFVLTGIIIISVGVSIKAYFTTYEVFLDSQYFSAPNLLIAIGSIIFIVAFFGCCGAVKQNYCMVVTFCSLLVLIFILEFAAGISGYVLKHETAEYLTNALEKNMVLYNQDNHTNPETEMWDYIQREFNCCGINTYKDWYKHHDYLPLSCCTPLPGASGNVICSNVTTQFMRLHTTSCVNGFGNFLREHAVTIGGIGIGFAAMQLIGIIFSCNLAKQLKLTYVYM